VRANEGAYDYAYDGHFFDYDYDDADEADMKCDRFTRKSTLKRHNRSHDDVTLFDLTRGDYAGEAILLSELGYGIPTDADGIARLPNNFKTAEDILNWCAALCSESPTANSLWAAAEVDGWSVALSDLKSGGFYLNTDAKEITLDHFALSPSALGRSPYFRNALICTLVQALRDIWHEEVFGALESVYMPEDVLMLERARAADCDTVTIIAGWELRGAGYADIWRHIIGSDEGDMALIFTRVLERDPSSLFDGSALAYAFRQWYVDETRVNAVDHQTLESLDTMIAKADASFGAKRLNGAMIEALSELPDGNRYLHGLGQTVKDDPFFAGMHDEINQTHLFHLIYDMQVVMVNNVPFRDAKLARLIFPDGKPVIKMT
jgi:hypothetical protein